jgi:hydrogenase maturation protease
LNPPSILIACVGNIFMGDDGVGVAVARKLLERSWPAGVRVVDFGIRARDLIYALMDGHDHVILVDAVDRGGQPGTIYVVEPELSCSVETALAVDSHGIDPASALEMAAAMGAEFKSIRLVGCQPAACLPGMNLSEPVEASVATVVAVIERTVANIHADRIATPRTPTCEPSQRHA